MNALAIQRRARSIQATHNRTIHRMTHGHAQRELILNYFVGLQSQLLLNAEPDAAALLGRVIDDFKLHY